MRLVDADALKAQGWKLNRYVCGMTTATYETKDLDDVPIVDAELVRHGHWLFYEEPDGYYHSECSECGQWCDEDVFLKGKWHYCPNCGAKIEWVKMKVELRPCPLLKWALCDGDCEKCRTFATTETVYNRYTDTAGNYHWTGVYSGEHTVKMDGGERKEDETY